MEESINKRIKDIVKVHYNNNVSAAARDMDIKQSTLKSVVTGDVKPSYETIAKILKADWLVIQGIRAEWLLFGTGNMFADNPSEISELSLAESAAINYQRKGSPYYDVDFIGGFDLVLNNQTINPEYYIDFDPYNKPGVMWCNITGHSMEPSINHGDIIAIKEVPDWQSYLTFGEIYAIVTTNNMRTVKKIRKGTTTEQYKLVPVNMTDYDEQDIEKSKISKVFEVLGCMKRF